MADSDIALALADAMKNDERVNAALIEWLDERYPVEISDGVKVTGLREAIRLVLAEGRRRLDDQDARQDRIEALITELAQRTEASAKEHAERMTAIESSHAAFLEESRAFRESIRRLECVQAQHSATLAEHSIALAEIREGQAEHSAMLAEHTVTLAGHSAILAEHSAILAEHSATLAEHSVTLGEHSATLAEHSVALADIRRQQAEHSDSLARIDRNVQRMGARISGMRGIEIERRLRRDIPAILMNRFGCRRGRIVWSDNNDGRISDRAASDAFLDKLESALEEGGIEPSQYIGLQSADLIAKGLHMDDGSEMWIVGEASGVISRDDVDRAKERVAAVARLECANARGFVYGEYIDRSVADYARAAGVDVVISPQP